MTLAQHTMNPDRGILIVSGLPRSGTSMMMRMLQAGGIPVLIDHQRQPDEDNPRGYCEFEPVKRTKDDPGWIPQAKGKVVKMVYRLLYDLPSDYNYQVIFMRRQLDEVVSSQNVMLQRHNPSHDTSTDAKVKELFASELSRVARWLAEQPNFRVLDVDYNRLLRQVEQEVSAVREFLGINLDAPAMAAVVDPLLYRNRR